MDGNRTKNMLTLREWLKVTLRPETIEGLRLARDPSDREDSERFLGERLAISAYTSQSKAERERDYSSVKVPIFRSTAVRLQLPFALDH